MTTTMQPQTGPMNPPPQVPYAHAAVASPARWSALAITAFIMSLLGFLGFTAVLGIVFGIVGIVVTRGGNRRGRGLAIAAIPISLVTGALSILLVITVIFMGRVAQLPVELKRAFVTNASAGVHGIRALATDDFNEAVSDEALQSWLSNASAELGTLVDIQPDEAQWFEPLPGGRIAIKLNAKFVNGTATVRVTYASAIPAGFEDIEVDGTSPLGEN